MKYTLNYMVDAVLVTLSVDAVTPEEAESKMKSCVAKMLKHFPIGQVFAYLNAPPLNMPIVNIPNGQWVYGTLAPIGQQPAGIPLGQQGILTGQTTTYPLNGNYVYTVGGDVQADPNGTVFINNMAGSVGVPTANSGGYLIPSADGQFSMTVTSSAGATPGVAAGYQQDQWTENSY